MAAPESLSREQWRQIAVAGYGPTLVASIGHGAVLPLVAISAVRLGASVGLAAFIVALISIGSLLGDLPAGYVAARLGEKWAIVLACLLDAAGMLAAFVAHALPVLAVAVFLIGLTGATFGVARQSFLTEAVPVRTRGRALSTLGGVFRVGGFLGPLAGAGVVAAWGLPPAYAFSAAMSVLAALVTLTLPDVPREATSDGPRPSLLAVARAHVRTLLTIGVGCFMIMLVRSARQALLPLWCEAHHLSAAATSLIYSASMLCDVLLFLPGGYLMDRLGRWWLCVPSMIVMAVGLLLLPLATTALPIAAVAMLLGVGNGVSSGIVMTLGSDASPALGRTQFLAVFRLFGDAGVALAPLVISAISAAAPLAASALALGALGLGGAGWLTKWLPRSRDAHLRTPAP